VVQGGELVISDCSFDWVSEVSAMHAAVLGADSAALIWICRDQISGQRRSS